MVRLGPPATLRSCISAKEKLHSFPAQTARLSQPAAALLPEHLFGDGPAAQGITDELPAQSSRQFGRTEGGLEFAAVVAGRAGLQKRRGPQNSPAKGSDHTEPAASSEVATMRMSLRDMSGSLCGMPRTTPSCALMAINSAAPAGEWQNKTLSTSRGHGLAWLFNMDTGLVSEWAFSPN